jgi:hypothetical protein
MEVDLLCDDGPDTRIAVELDGDQHLDNPVAYRNGSDRRRCQGRSSSDQRRHAQPITGSFTSASAVFIGR